MMSQLQPDHAWIVGNSGYPHLPWLLVPLCNPVTPADVRFNEAQGHSRRVVENTFGLLKTRFRCLDRTGGALQYSPLKEHKKPHGMIAFGNISLICACTTMACARLLVMSFLWNGVLGAPEDYTLTAPWDVTAQEGLCVLIPCQFTFEKPWWTGYESRRGYWFFEGTKIKDPAVASSNDEKKMIYADTRGRFRLVGDLAKRDCSLSINDVRRSDARNYYFRYEHSQSSSIKYSYEYFPVQLTVVGLRDQPEIYLPQGMMEGKWMTVECTAPGRCSGTAPEITWSSESRFEYNPSDHPIYNLDGTRTYRSTIAFTALRDHNYKSLSCSVYFPAADASSAKSIRLNIEYPPAAPAIIQYGAEGGTETTIVSPMVMREGFDYTLVCTVDSNPLSTLTWKKEESMLGESAGTTNSLQLTLRDVTSSDDGDYYCGASNIHGSRFSSITACVEYPPRTPKINAEDVTTTGGKQTPIASSMGMQEGFDYTLVCTVDSNPVSKLTWKKSENILGVSVSSSNTLQLTLRNVTSSDDGDYYCFAANKHGSNSNFITAHVEYPPRTPKINAEDVTTTDWSGKQVNVSNEMIMEGRTLNMHCSVDSSPPASLTWIKGGETKLEKDAINNLTLRLSNVTCKDEGQYWCVAKNKHGLANSSVFISVLEMESPNQPRAAIIGGVVAGLVVLAGVCFLAWMMYCRRAKDANMESRDKMEAVGDSRVIYSAINKTPKGPRTGNNLCTDATTMDSKEDLYENFRRDIIQYSSIHFSRAKPGSQPIPVPEETLYSEVKVH